MRTTLTTVFLCVFGLLTACSSEHEAAKNTATPPPTMPEVRMVEPLSNADFPPATANKTAANSSILDRANRQARVDADPNATPAALQFKTAAENSQIAVNMDADGVVREIRVFKSHPKLVRIESTFLGDDEKALKFTMRNGEVIEVKTKRIGNLQTATTAELLAIARR